MYVEEGERLRERWGDKPCDHLSFEREYWHGTHDTDFQDKKTDDYICTQCGKTISRAEKEAIESQRRV